MSAVLPAGRQLCSGSASKYQHCASCRLRQAWPHYGIAITSPVSVLLIFRPGLASTAKGDVQLPFGALV